MSSRRTHPRAIRSASTGPEVLRTKSSRLTAANTPALPTHASPKTSTVISGAKAAWKRCAGKSTRQM